MFIDLGFMNNPIPSKYFLCFLGISFSSLTKLFSGSAVSVVHIVEHSGVPRWPEGV